MKIVDLLNMDTLLHEECIDIYEMANLHKEDTGISNVVIWVSGGGEKLKHGPRIKVVHGNKFKPELSSTIPLTPPMRIIGNADVSQEEFAQIIDWIELNRDIILKYWNDEISTHTLLDSIKKI